MNSSLLLLPPSSLPFSHHLPLRRRIPHAVSGDNSGDPSPTSEPLPPPPPQTPPPPKLGIKNRVRSRNQARRLREASPPATAGKTEKLKKEWEEMTLAEKAVELYVGEKGLLFWLNKFAYASIFAVIGGWILFRFVGPSIGLYELDSPPLPPTSLFKGSP